MPLLGARQVLSPLAPIMILSKPFLALSLALLIGAGAAAAPERPAKRTVRARFAAGAPTGGGSDLVAICFRNRNVQVPFYLLNRYTANGATFGDCPVSQM